MIRVISVEEYTVTLKGKDGISVAKPDTQRKASRAVTDFKEYLSERGKMIPDESDIEEYRVKLEATDGSKNKSATVQKITYIRGYYALNEERSKGASMTTETTQEAQYVVNEPETVPCVDDSASTKPETWLESDTVQAARKKPGRKSAGGEKKIQVSCYLAPETYGVLRVLAQATTSSVGEILSNCATAIAKKNVDNGTYDKAQQALQALSTITVQYSE